jgi:single-stranded DNA-binding protein
MEGAIGMNKVMLVGRLTRDPELRSLPSGKHVATFTMADSVIRYDDHRCSTDRRLDHPTARLAHARHAARRD